METGGSKLFCPQREKMNHFLRATTTQTQNTIGISVKITKSMAYF